MNGWLRRNWNPSPLPLSLSLPLCAHSVFLCFYVSRFLLYFLRVRQKGAVISVANNLKGSGHFLPTSFTRFISEVKKETKEEKKNWKKNYNDREGKKYDAKKKLMKEKEEWEQKKRRKTVAINCCQRCHQEKEKNCVHSLHTFILAILWVFGK